MTIMKLTYNFDYMGKNYNARNVAIGDTVDRMDTFDTGEMALSAICHALGDAYGLEWQENIVGNPFPALDRLEALGFTFKRLEGSGYQGDDDECDYLSVKSNA